MSTSVSIEYNASTPAFTEGEEGAGKISHSHRKADEVLENEDCYGDTAIEVLLMMVNDINHFNTLASNVDDKPEKAALRTEATRDILRIIAASTNPKIALVARSALTQVDTQVTCGSQDKLLEILNP